MNRRQFLTTTSVLLVSACVAPIPLPAQTRKPNVLFIIADDLRPLLGCYGNTTVKTPNIDALARRGVIFDRAYCQQAVCGPSRISMLSGYRPDSTGIYSLQQQIRDVMPDALTLPRHFKEAGYRTVSLGKIYHHAGDDRDSWTDREELWGERWAMPEHKGMSTERADVEDNAYADGQAADRAIHYLRTTTEPLFLAVGFRKPHLPFSAPSRYWNLYSRDQFSVPPVDHPEGGSKFNFPNWVELRGYKDIPDEGNVSDEKALQLIHGYHAAISYMDAQVGRILAEVDDSTIVVLWGDHGFKIGEYGDWCKHTNLEIDTHTPLIIAGPGMMHGARCDALVEAVDIYPTLADLCGLGVPAHCEGLSMVPLLRDPALPWKSAAFSQYPRYELTNPKIMGYSMRTQQYRYTEWIEIATGDVLEVELYDHSNGPIADRNLATDKGYESIVSALSTQLKNGWQRSLPPTESISLLYRYFAPYYVR